MSTDGSRTKAQLIEEVGALKTKIAEWEAFSAKTAAAKPLAPEPVRDADAIEGCVRALNDLGVRERVTGNIGSSTGTWRLDTLAVDRVLRYLASRYGVPLIDVQVRDCARRHVDELTSYQFEQAFRSAVGQ